MKTTTAAVARAIKQAFEEVYIESAVAGKLTSFLNVLEEAAMSIEMDEEQNSLRMNRAKLGNEIAQELDEIL